MTAQAHTPDSRPALVAVDADPGSLERIEGELCRRYAADYRIMSIGSADQALAELEALRDRGEQVAVVLADQWMPKTTTSTSAVGRSPLGHEARPGNATWSGAGVTRGQAIAALRQRTLTALRGAPRT